MDTSSHTYPHSHTVRSLQAPAAAQRHVVHGAPHEARALPVDAANAPFTIAEIVSAAVVSLLCMLGVGLMGYGLGLLLSPTPAGLG